MPQGACTVLDSVTWTKVREVYDDARKHGLEYEWLQFFIGGLVNDKLSPIEAAYEAAIEWDF